MKHNIKKFLPISIIDSLAIFVSLYIFILIFFVLLNTIVRNNQSSSDKVFISLTKAFNHNELKVIREMPNKIKLNIVEKITSNIPSYVKILPTETYNNKHLLRIAFTHKDFLSEELEVKEKNQEFLRFISELLISKIDDQILFLTIIFNYKNEANKNDFIKEFTSFYNNFRSLNLNNKNYKVGLNESNNDDIIFNIYLK